MLRFLTRGLLCAAMFPALVLSVASAATNHDHGHAQKPAEQPAAKPAPATQHDHGNHGEHGGHMALIAAFKKTVPEDYRIMERTPVIDSQESLLAGRKLYMTYCAVCHGTLGRGDGPGAAGLKIPPADFLDFSHSAHFGPGEKYWLIARGSKNLGMPAHAKVAPKDVWHMVNYILALQAKVKSEGYDSPPHKH